jgi:aminodeoxychorismate synthase, glutamine amidotransferase subunit (EC 6.3.5.8)
MHPQRIPESVWMWCTVLRVKSRSWVFVWATRIIGQAFGCKIKKALEPVHGKVHAISHDNAGVFDGLNNPLKVTRYHSLVVENQEIPDFFEITARTDQNEIMGMRHKDYHIEGVQFHPEAILTEMGMELLDNFYQSTKENGVRC